jgi:transposase
MTGAVFRVYVEKILVPELGPGDVVVMDNLAAHKGAGVAAAIQAAGASLMHLPPYSPDLNPIEQAFAKLKTLLRKAAARTRDELWDTIGTLLDAFTPDGTSSPSYGRARGGDGWSVDEHREERLRLAAKIRFGLRAGQHVDKL